MPRLLLSTRPFSFLGWLCLLALLCGLALLAKAADRAPGPKTMYFTSGGQQIQVDYFAPATASPRAAVVVLHGAGGMLFDGPDMRRMATRLAEAGYAAYLVHYFDRTGSIAVTDPIMRQHFNEWLPTVRDAIGWVRAQPGNNGRPVGVYGYSLGAFLSLAVASENKEVGAVVEQAGGIWYGQRERLRHLPPVLMIHGREDQRVPLQKFEVPLQALLKERGVTVQARLFPGEGHRFTQPTEQKVRDQAVAFYDRQLQPPTK